jgi:hypothetical protein
MWTTAFLLIAVATTPAQAAIHSNQPEPAAASTPATTEVATPTADTPPNTTAPAPE